MGIQAFIYKFFRGGTHLNRVGSELAFFFLLRYLFCYSWFRLQLIAIHCNRRVVWTEHPGFLEHFHPCAHIVLWLKFSHDVSV